MKIINADEVHSALDFNTLIPILRKAFTTSFNMPPRQVYDLDPDSNSSEGFALLPCWNDDVIGMKAFTHFPDNSDKKNLEILYSKIMLFKRATGEPLALVDGTSVTYWRTAAVSALASQLLSRPDSSKLLLFGSGNLAPYIIEAHLSVRPIRQVIISARTESKAILIIEKLSKKYPQVSFDICRDLEDEVSSADIICCATGSATPLFDGQLVSAGTHIDCLGNHFKDKRECDTTTIRRSKVYVGCLSDTLAEAGEILIAISENNFNANDIVADLSTLCSNPDSGRSSNDEITLFKSVGTALSDLVTAYHIAK